MEQIMININNINMAVPSQVDKNRASVEQQKLRKEIVLNTAPQGSQIIKPNNTNVDPSSLKSRYIFAIGDEGKKILRLQIDLATSNLSVFA